MLRISVLLLFISGCTGRSEHFDRMVTASAGTVSPSQLVPGEPALVARMPVTARGSESSGSHIMEWSDSARRGDTTYFVRGRVVSTNVVHLDSQWVRLPAVRLPAGIPVGLFNGWDGITLRPNTEVFTLTYSAEAPVTLLSRLALARSRGVKMVIGMTGGARANYLTDGVFDVAKWRARMQAFNTPAIRSAVAQAVAEGVLIGNTVMDEPFNEGGPGNEANSWGPRGTMNKARVDSLCGYAKALFPTLPQGVFQDFRLAPDDSYMVCDFVTSQYRVAKGPLTAYRDGALALCRRDHHACSFAINVLDGGIPVRRQPGQTDYLEGDCPLTTTGGRGTYFPNCRMTAEQVREAGQVLGSAGCFLTGFRYDAEFMAKAENRAAFRDVAAALAARPGAPLHPQLKESLMNLDQLFLTNLRNTLDVYRRGVFNRWEAVAVMAWAIDLKVKRLGGSAPAGDGVDAPKVAPKLQLEEPLSPDDQLLKELYDEAVDFWVRGMGQLRLMK